MSIELPPNKIGLMIFLLILVIFEMFFIMIGYLIANYFNLNGMIWCLTAIVIFLILNMLFVNIKFR